MTEEKFTKLSEEDLDLVAGGTLYKDCFVFRKSDGNYIYIETKFDGSEATHQQVIATASKGKIPDLTGISGSQSGRRGGGAQNHDRYIAMKKEKGYTIHYM